MHKPFQLGHPLFVAFDWSDFHLAVSLRVPPTVSVLPRQEDNLYFHQQPRVVTCVSAQNIGEDQPCIFLERT